MKEYKYTEVKRIINGKKYNVIIPEKHSTIDALLYEVKDLNAWDQWANISNYHTLCMVLRKGEKRWENLYNGSSSYFELNGINMKNKGIYHVLVQLEKKEIRDRIIKKMNKKISIIIPTKNAYKQLKRLFNSLDPISDKIEVIVVDGCSTDGTINMAQSRDYVTFISVPYNYTVGKSRNIGIKKAKYDIKVLLDADTKITPMWYNELLSSMGKFDIVAGWSPSPDNKHLPRVSVEVKGQDITYPQCNIAYKSSVFDNVGLLAENMKCAEDCEFNYRCILHGYVISYNPLMKAYHYQRSTAIGRIKKAIKNGYGRYELNKIHPELKHLHQHGLKIQSIVRLFFGACGYIKGSMGVIKNE